MRLRGERSSRYAMLAAGLVALGAPATAPANTPRAPSSPVAGITGVSPLTGGSAPTAKGRASIGSFGSLFTEPTIDGQRTSQKCIPSKAHAKEGYKDCKPAAGTINALPDGRILYWDALEGTENNKYSIVAEFGKAATNDSARLLTLGKHPRWRIPRPYDGGANHGGDPSQAPLIPGFQSTETYNDGALFGSDQVFLPDGRLLVQGGTDYSLDPQVGNTGIGETELQGVRSTRIFNPRTNRFTQTGNTAIGRWYPSLTELGNGKVLVVGGVRKLIKPIYSDAPLESGRNVTQTETFDTHTGRWHDNGAAAQRSLPLYPRLHELPDGHVLYNAGGQPFDPAGEGYDEALWSQAASYDPKAGSWKTLGIPNLGTLEPGFRGSTFSVELPLRPDRQGHYRKANFLTAGGVLLPSPGSYFGISASNIASVDTTAGRDKFTTHETGPLHTGRWFGSGVLLPTGGVLAISGSDRDDVVGPGVEIPIRQLELFDAKTEKWHPVASQANGRTYHNSATLLPDGRVLVAGHAPISTLYANDTTIPGGFADHSGRDPSFQLYRPPYLFWGARPVIRRAPKAVRYGRRFTVTTNTLARRVKEVVLIRHTAATHVVDGGQSSIQLRVVGRRGHTLTLAAPPNGDVTPPGPYMLFVNRSSAKGPIPSKAAEVSVRR